MNYEEIGAKARELVAADKYLEENHFFEDRLKYNVSAKDIKRAFQDGVIGHGSQVFSISETDPKKDRFQCIFKLSILKGLAVISFSTDKNTVSLFHCGKCGRESAEGRYYSANRAHQP